jgi:hypothetical protein
MDGMGWNAIGYSILVENVQRGCVENMVGVVVGMPHAEYRYKSFHL